MYPENKDAIRVVLCVNQRRALHAPLVHQSLVGGVMLEYKEPSRAMDDKHPSAAKAPISLDDTL